MTALQWAQQEKRALSGRRNNRSSQQVPDNPAEIVVVHTTCDGTLAALKNAVALAHGFAARIRVVVPHVVPYALPLDHPQVSPGFLERRFRTVTEGLPVDVQFQIVLCRDRRDALEATLQAHSLVVLSSGGSWWPTPESRLAWRLRRQGHQVLICSIS